MNDSTVVLNRKSVALTLLIYVVLVIFFALIGLTVLEWPKYQKLSRDALKTVGRVVGKEPSNHNFVRYSFEVDHMLFAGIGNAGGENPSFDELKVGDSVIVYYDPEDPNRSFLGNPKSQATSATTGVIFIALVGSVLSIIGLYSKSWLPIFSGKPRP